MSNLQQCQGSVVSVSHDMIVARYNSKGVLFKRKLLVSANRTFRIDDIVQFNAKKATTIDIEVGDEVSRNCGYEIGWLGTDIKFIKQGRLLNGEGVVLTIPDPQAQFMFVDWKFTKNPPALGNKCTTTNVFITRASIRPEVEKLTDLFKVGQKVKFVAREQAPNARGVCWRAAIATDEFHEITSSPVPNSNRPNYSVHLKVAHPLSSPSSAVQMSSTPSSSSNYWQSMASSSEKEKTPPTFDDKRVTVSGLQLPPPVNGFNYLDLSVEGCEARFQGFAQKYREEHPSDIFSQRSFEGMLKIKYLAQMNEEIAVIHAAVAAERTF